MNPVRKIAVVGLLEWISKNKPSVKSLSGLDRERFMEHVTDYELAKGINTISNRNSDLWRKWESTHMYFFENAHSDQEALAAYD
ncbi:hypothetical protein GLI01_34170 [Gluconacetobacter liquefaciens]|uniref:Uncharacterized protein n=1 Tax=Gluconacetobacter liquefaciens TaxID=89584 RepID=A0A370FXM9_GLULI|nr:hypothetical protein [Gluconacetobacter liquefaciens]MBB2188086.1 hypothetical protein [Gluconacetobacter liquefaciens]RDI36198.1 hypothetical protein C7453_11279 [Gluconacetobacter liquefaciens]GBR11218.1 hypothetical protein AA0522_2463 [Gluconacetobacter liquefaciens NRIC 0522]GEB39382.1 hypothetical protein GLI01_34170 [Gluconacetobacter liquefaciens]